MFLVQVTLIDPTQFRVLCNTRGHRVFSPLRNAVVNPHRHFEVGRRTNEHDAQTLAASADNPGSIHVLHRHCRPIINRRSRHPPRLDPLGADDLTLFEACLAGQHAINRFGHAHLQQQLQHRPAPDGAQARRRCERAHGLIVTLRGHGPVAKEPRRHLYRVTPYGQRFMSTAVAVHNHYLLVANQQTTAWAFARPPATSWTARIPRSMSTMPLTQRNQSPRTIHRNPAIPLCGRLSFSWPPPEVSQHHPRPWWLTLDHRVQTPVVPISRSTSLHGSFTAPRPPPLRPPVPRSVQWRLPLSYFSHHELYSNRRDHSS